MKGQLCGQTNKTQTTECSLERICLFWNEGVLSKYIVDLCKQLLLPFWGVSYVNDPVIKLRQVKYQTQGLHFRSKSMALLALFRKLNPKHVK